MAQDFSPALSASDEIHDFHLIALTDDCFIEGGAFEHGDVVLDGDAARVDLEVPEQFGDGQRTAELDPVPIQGNSQRPRTRPILSQSTMSLEWDNDLSMLDREAVIAWYLRNRERTRTLFDLVAGGGAEGDGAYYKRPIALRHPIVFYEGHLPAFSFNTLVKKGLGGPSIDPRLEALFARGIDPHEVAKARRLKADSTTFAASVRDGRPATRCMHLRPRPIGACSMRCAGQTWSARVIHCSTAGKRCSRSSSTRRCITKRCYICGIACRSRTSIGPMVTRRVSMDRCPGRNGSRFPAGRAGRAAPGGRAVLAVLLRSGSIATI